MWWPEHAQETPHWGQLSRQGARMYHRKNRMFQTDQDLGRSFWLGSASQGLPLQFSRRESNVGFWKVYSIDFGEVAVLPSTLSCPRIYGVCSRMYQAVQLAWCAATLLSEGTQLHSFYSRVSWRCCISCTTCVHLAQVIYCKSHIMAAAPLPNTSEPPAKRARKQHAILKSLLTQNLLQDLLWGLMAWWFPPAFVRTETQRILWGLHLDFWSISNQNKKKHKLLVKDCAGSTTLKSATQISETSTWSGHFKTAFTAAVAHGLVLIGLAQLEDWYEQNKDCGSCDFTNWTLNQS